MKRLFISLLLILCSVFHFCRKSVEPLDESNNQPLDQTDTTQIVFVSNRESNENIFQIFMMDIFGNNVRRLTNDANNYFYPQFAPDGNYFIFYSQNGSEDEIYRMDIDGGHFLNLTNSPGNDRIPQFSPDGSKIAFVSDRDGNREIYLMDNDGANQVRLTNNNILDHSPQFSPDGQLIVFFSLVEDPWGPDSYDIYTINIDGSNLTRLTEEGRYKLHTGIPDNSPNVFDASPRFSPDGSQIIFMVSEQNDYVIFMMDADGSNPRALADQPGGNFAAFFYPLLPQILFRSHRDGDFDLYRMDYEGEAQIRITDDTGHTYFGDFSTDGSKILYFSNIDEISYKYYHIYAANADGSQRIKLTHGNFADYFPCFQPDFE